MRGDMPKVIVERPRRGGGWVRKGRPLRDDDVMSAADAKVEERKRGKSKNLNENLAPLKRYLASQANRPWDKVWSEVCANLKPSNTVQQHVRDHIPDFVAINTSLKDGEVWVHDRFSLRPLKGSYTKLYVDPKSGLLRRNKHFTGWKKWKQERRVAEAKARDERMRKIAPGKQLHLLDDGSWWEVTLALVPTTVMEEKTRYGVQRRKVELGVDDAVLRAGLSKLGREELYDGRGVYAVSKRQLSKKEIRDFQLR